MVNAVFNTALNREMQQALDENNILRFAFETAILNVPARYQQLQDHTIRQIGATLETGGYKTSRFVRISDEQKNPLYTSDGFTIDNSLLSQTEESMKAYKITQAGGRYYVQTTIVLKAVDRRLYLETLKDISTVFEERDLGFSIYRRVTVIVLFCGALIMYLLSFWLTKPVRQLSNGARSMATGDYGHRANKTSNDELGLLTEDFNNMANALEEKINQFQEEARAREYFVVAFAHELKTPLTSIIGYADLLRSRKMDDEKQVMSANYIYQEGKRLKVLSLRLLEMIVLKRRELMWQPVSVSILFSYWWTLLRKDTAIDLPPMKGFIFYLPC